MMGLEGRKEEEIEYFSSSIFIYLFVSFFFCFDYFVISLYFPYGIFPLFSWYTDPLCFIFLRI